MEKKIEKATARPWKIFSGPDNNVIDIVDCKISKEIIARTHSTFIGSHGLKEGIANAELIVKAVNSHDALLEACKDLLAISVRSGLDNGKNTDSDICNNARKEITQAESK
jgi:hypothetical protein